MAEKLIDIDRIEIGMTVKMSRGRWGTVRFVGEGITDRSFKIQPMHGKAEWFKVSRIDHPMTVLSEM